MGDFEVLAQELEREAEEGLVLDVSLVVELCRRGVGEKGTSIKWASGFNLLVIWSAMLRELCAISCREAEGAA